MKNLFIKDMGFMIPMSNKLQLKKRKTLRLELRGSLATGAIHTCRLITTINSF